MVGLSSLITAVGKMCRLIVLGLITGVTGAAGDLGGVVFLLIARYSGTAYDRVFLIVGVLIIGCNILVSWIRPVSKGQLGGR